jgi:hypothetical protein
MRIGVRATAPAIAIATFSITLGVSLWYQHHALPADQIAVTVAATPADAPIVHTPPLASSAIRVAAPDQPPIALQAVVTPKESEAAPTSFSTVEVPAFVLVGPGTNESGRQATLRNSSPRSLQISVTANNPATGHQATAQVTLAPFQRLSLADTGFRVEPGDVLILSSPPFRDRQIDVEAAAN